MTRRREHVSLLKRARLNPETGAIHMDPVQLDEKSDTEKHDKHNVQNITKPPTSVTANETTIVANNVRMFSPTQNMKNSRIPTKTKPDTNTNDTDKKKR